MAKIPKMIEKPCVICKKLQTVFIPIEGYTEWQNGKLIQEALPEISLDVREFLISGICGLCTGLKQ